MLLSLRKAVILHCYVHWAFPVMGWDDVGHKITGYIAGSGCRRKLEKM